MLRSFARTHEFAYFFGGLNTWPLTVTFMPGTLTASKRAGSAFSSWREITTIFESYLLTPVVLRGA